MESHINIVLVLFNDVPYELTYLICAELIEDSIASKNDEIKLSASIFEVHNFWVTNDHTWHSTEIWMFGFYITKSPRYRKSSWGHSIGTYEGIVKVLVGHSYKLIDCHLLYHRSGIVSFKYGL
jgi:hypothetical protein